MTNTLSASGVAIPLVGRLLAATTETHSSYISYCGCHKGKGKGSFYIAQYPVRWTAQSASHCLPSLTDLFIPTPFSASPGSILAMMLSSWPHIGTYCNFLPSTSNVVTDYYRTICINAHTVVCARARNVLPCVRNRGAK